MLSRKSKILASLATVATALGLTVSQTFAALSITASGVTESAGDISANGTNLLGGLESYGELMFSYLPYLIGFAFGWRFIKWLMGAFTGHAHN